MGFQTGNVTASKKLETLVRHYESSDQETLAKACDLVSTHGHDREGDLDPELVEVMEENGIGLGMAAIRYDVNAAVFFAFGEVTNGVAVCYYVFGKDEEDAIRRLSEGMSGESTPKPIGYLIEYRYAGEKYTCIVENCAGEARAREVFYAEYNPHCVILSLSPEPSWAVRLEHASRGEVYDSRGYD